MSIGKRILTAALLLVISACSGRGSAMPPYDSDPMVEWLRLESLYMQAGVKLAKDAPPARVVALKLMGRINSAMQGMLILDSNACSVSAFGDRVGCTKIAGRGIEIEVRRVSLTDPGDSMRRYFEVVGEGLPGSLALIVQGRLERGALERCYLVMGDELVPLYLGADG